MAAINGVLTEHQLSAVAKLADACSDLDERLRALEQTEREQLEQLRKADGGHPLGARPGTRRAAAAAAPVAESSAEDEEAAREREMLAEDMAMQRHITEGIKQAQPEGKHAQSCI